jgi:hypothetical protein
MTDIWNKNKDVRIPFDDEHKHDKSGMKKLMQVIANITENESPKELNGMEQDMGDFSGGSE